MHPDGTGCELAFDRIFIPSTVNTLTDILLARLNEGGSSSNPSPLGSPRRAQEARAEEAADVMDSKAARVVKSKNGKERRKEDVEGECYPWWSMIARLTLGMEERTPPRRSTRNSPVKPQAQSKKRVQVDDDDSDDDMPLVRKARSATAAKTVSSAKSTSTSKAATKASTSTPKPVAQASTSRSAGSKTVNRKRKGGDPAESDDGERVAGASCTCNDLNPV